MRAQPVGLQIQRLLLEPIATPPGVLEIDCAADKTHRYCRTTRRANFSPMFAIEIPSVFFGFVFPQRVGQKVGRKMLAKLALSTVLASG